MNLLSKLRIWPSLENHSETHFKPLIDPKDLDAKVDAFFNTTNCLFKEPVEIDVQVIGRRVIQLCQSENKIKIEYDSGYRLRISSKIPLSFDYLKLSNEEKIQFNHFLVHERDALSANPYFTPNLVYSSSKSKTVRLKCLAYCFDFNSSTAEQFKETLQDWDQALTKLRYKANNWQNLTPYVIFHKKSSFPKATNLKDFFTTDLLCVNTFQLLPGLSQLKTDVELRRLNKQNSLITVIGQRIERKELFFIGYLSWTGCFSSFEPSISEQNFIMQAIDDNASKVLPANVKNRIKNNSDSYNDPEYRTQTFALSFSKIDLNATKKDFDQFEGSLLSIKQFFNYQK